MNKFNLIDIYIICLILQHLQKSSNEVTELYSKIKEIEDKLAVSEREQITLKSDVKLWKEKFTNEQVREFKIRVFVR